MKKIIKILLIPIVLVLIAGAAYAGYLFFLNGRVYAFSGDVQVFDQEKGEWNSLDKNTTLKEGNIIKTGKVRTIDAAQVEGEVFFIVTGMGFDALIGKVFNEQEIRGLLPYFTIGFREYKSYKYEVFVLKFNNKQVAVSALFVTIANLKGWGGGAIISPKAECDDGLLDICVIHRAPWYYIVANLYKLFTGGVVKLRKYSRYQAKSVEIIREGPGPYHFDGESRDGGTTLHVSVLPKALKVIVPGQA